ncbi:MAG: (d)CMP kinase [Spirochaetota bacterium]
MSYNELHAVAHLASIPAIAISGRSGCGNTTVNHLVAKKLGFTGINYTMRNYAEEQGLSFEEVVRLAQADSQIDRRIDRRQVELCLAREHAVLSSRLAIWLLPQAALKVYLYASAKVRSRRIWQREGGTEEEQLHKTLARDQRDAERYRQLYGIDSEDFFFVDLILNTETFNQYQISDTIVQAYRLRYFSENHNNPTS